MKTGMLSSEFFAKQAKKPSLQALTVPRFNQFMQGSPTPKQAVFLLLHHLEALYGGAAGGGKTEALLRAALQYVDIPGYSALLLRRTYGQLNMADSLLDRAHKWLRGTGARWQAMHNRYVFPSTAQLQFGYLQYLKDVYQYDSAAFQFIGFDELTQFHEPQYRFLFNRLRRLEGSAIPLRMRAATNPGGLGHEWVKTRFLREKQEGRIFVPAKLTDNPYLDQESYRLALSQLDPITRKQREEGDWDVTSDGVIFRREWFSLFQDHLPQTENCSFVRFWDLAASDPRTSKAADPDYTVGTLLGRSHSGRYWVADVQRFRLDPGNVQDRIRNVAIADGRSIPIRMEQEPGASGKALVHNYTRVLSGWDLRGVSASGPKTARWSPFAAQCRNGNVGIITGPWNLQWLEEILAVPESAHDDQADSVAGAFNYFVTEFNTSSIGLRRI